MDFEDYSVSGSSSSQPSSAAEDPMVEMELEAAEALADLAHLAMRETAAPDWDTRRKRTKKRLITGSPSTTHSGFHSNSHQLPVPSPPRSVDPVYDQPIADEQQDRPVFNNVAIKQVKDEEDVESPKPSPTGTPRFTSTGGSRSRQNLTEAEKEDRKIRRILANRESARQTIRRRQALSEELTRKAAQLALENERLKKEKELALNECQSLETINKNLKAQVAAKAIKHTVSETQGESNSNVDTFPSQSANFPFLMYNHPQHPLAPLGWPSIIQSSYPVHSQQQTQSDITGSSNIPDAGKVDSPQAQENPVNINLTIAPPVYLVPCPWFFPFQDTGKGFHDIQYEVSMHNDGNGSSSSRGITHVQNQPLFFPSNIKNEAFGSAEVGSNSDINANPVGCQPNQCGLHARESSHVVKNETGLQDYAEAVSASREKKQVAYSCQNRMQVDAVAAAEARKRRKEVTKLKNLNGRHQCRLQC